MKNKFSAEERWRLGSLPDPAPLAAAYIPMQESAKPQYDAGKALSRGTLFPGLDLPFMNLVNPELERTPMTELMAIDFVVDELELYLDTHWEDREAFELYQTMLAMQKEAKERIKSAIKYSGLFLPPRRIIINLAPAGYKKEGAMYDLPMAVAILTACGIIAPDPEKCAFIGELSLDGAVAPVNGVLPMVISLYKNGIRKIFVPKENAKEAAVIG